MQTGTYGAGFSGDLLGLISLVQGMGAPVAPPQDKLSLLSSYITLGQWPSMRTQAWQSSGDWKSEVHWDLLARGREITRSSDQSLSLSSGEAPELVVLANENGTAAVLAARLKQMATALVPDKGTTPPLTSGVARHFWTSDYTVAGT